MQLEQAKAARNVANEAFQSHLAQVQDDLVARGIGGRIVDKAGEIAAEAAEVANQNKAVVAGTLAALALWALRNPIITQVQHLFAGENETERTRKEDQDD